MAEPISTSIAGLKLSTLLGGFMGSLVSLSFVAGLGMWGRTTAVFTGTVTAAYVTPVVVSYWGVGSAAENGLGFLIGLTSMNLIPAIINASRWVRCNIKSIIAKKFGIDDKETK